MDVAGFCRSSPHNHAYQPFIIAHRRGREVESRGSDIACLDTVGPVIGI